MKRSSVPEDLLHSDFHLRTLLDNAPDMIFRIDRDMRIVFMNRRVLEVTGMTREQLTNMTVRGMGYPDAVCHLVEDTFRRAFESARPQEAEFPLDVEQDQRHFLMLVEPVCREDGEVDSLIGITRDITQRRHAREALEEEQARLRLFIEHAPAAMAMFDRDMTYLCVSRRWRECFNQTEEELIGRCHYEVHPDLPKHTMEAHAAGLAGQVITADEDEYRQRDGTTHWARWAVHPWRNSSGGVGGIVVFFEDITDRKVSQQQLQHQKELLQGIFDNAPIMFVLWDGQLQRFILNRYAEALMGWTSEDANDGDFMAKVYPDPEYRAKAAAFMQSLQDDWREWTVTCKDGTTFPGEWANIRLSDDTMVGIGVDLREREQALEAQKRLAQFPLENPNPVIRMDAAGKVLYANAAAWECLEAFGWSGEGELPPSFKDVALWAFGERSVVETELKGPHGVTLWLTVVHPKGENYVNLYGRDITQRKEAENRLLQLNQQLEQRVEARTAELREAEVKFRGLVENSSDILCQVDTDGILRYISPQAAAYGFEPAKMEGRSFVSAVHPDDREWMLEEFRTALISDRSIPSNFRAVAPDGTIYWFEERSTLQHDNNGRISGLTVVLRDITEKRKVDVERAWLDQQLQLALDAARLGWWSYDPQTHTTTYDQRYAEIFGISGDHCSAEDIFKIMHPNDLPRVKRAVEEAMLPGRNNNYSSEYRIIHPDGGLRWIEAHGMAVFEDHGYEQVLKAFVGTVEDITERMRMQEALENKVLSLTQPLDYSGGVAFEDLFDMDQIQEMQDEFSTATGVASIITRPDGTPITKPSNVTDFCWNVVRTTEKGRANCLKSDECLGRYHPTGPLIHRCQSSGLWDAGANIEVGGRHIANWLIGQVRNEAQTDEQMLAYGREIGADPEDLLEAFHRVPVMSSARFESVAKALHTLTRQISNSAYQNVLQARFIESQQRAEKALRESEERYRFLFDCESDAILVFDGETRRFIDVNPAAEKLYGYTHEEFLELTHADISADPEQAREAIPLVLSGRQLPMLMSHHRRRDGTVIPVEISASCLVLKGRKVVSAVIRDITQRVVHEQEIHHNREELRRLASELALANQRERQRIAGELHDGLSQLLSSATLWLDAATVKDLPDNARDSLEKVRGIMKDALGLTRSLTFDLSCPLLNELGLGAALEELCAGMSHEYAMQFEFCGDREAMPMDLDRQMILYRATRELMINVLKHSGAKSALVRLERMDKHVRICVADDGRGFDATYAGRGFSPSGGFGLFNIGEYIQHIGGSLSINSDPDGGTQVILRIPMEG